MLRHTFRNDDGTEVEVSLDVVDGRLEVVALTIRTAGRAITSDTLRRVPVGRYRVEATREHRDDLERLQVAAGDDESYLFNDDQVDAAFHRARREFWSHARELSNAERPGRVRMTSDRLADVAQLYRAAMADNLPPLVEIMQRYGTTKNTAAGWVQRARAAGLLPLTGRGIARA